MISKIPLAVAVVLALGVSAASAQETIPPTPVTLVRDVCSNCHGLHGRSADPTFPNLAGQPAAYIKKQLRQFRNHTRADPHAQAFMWGIASNMTGAMIDGLARYFARQTPAAGRPQKPALVAAGRKLFEKGDPKEGVPACGACHGAEAQGKLVFPRLAGQHRDYLIQQLVAFQSDTRHNAIMGANAHRMTHGQMEELAAYLASL